MSGRVSAWLSSSLLVDRLGVGQSVRLAVGWLLGKVSAGEMVWAIDWLSGRVSGG